jgi:hypothetical protein
MLVSRKISGPSQRLNFFYAGAVICGANFKSGEAYVHGLTLKFKVPAVATVTFASTPPGSQFPIPMADIISQITTAVPALAPRIWQVGDVHLLALVEATPANGVTVDKTGTVNSKFGLSSAIDTVGNYINPPGGATPYLVWLSAIDANTYVVTTEE